jgi:signal transduction histidine kinase
VKLEYQMQGIDKNWIATKNPGFARYANLPSGKYLFVIKAANSDGVWNPEMKTIQLIIATPFYHTWWFFVLCFLFVAGIIYSLYRYRIAQIMKLQLVRNRIARDLHDDIGSTLGSISFYSQLAKQKPADGNSGNEDLLTRIEDASREMIDKMGDIVWAINPVNDDFAHLLSRMQNFAAMLLSAQNISCDFICDDNLKRINLPMNARKNIFLIFKEAVYNSAKYSSCKKVIVKFSSFQNNLTMEIIDDGKGFEMKDATAYNGNGLKNMRARTEEMNAKLEINSAVNVGTTMRLEVSVR